MNRSILMKGALALSMVLVVFLAEYHWHIASLFHPDRIRDILEKSVGFAPFLYMIFMALAVVIRPIPINFQRGYIPGDASSHLIYNYFGSVLMAGRGLASILGLIMVFFLFVFPVLIERYDLLSMRKFFPNAN
jgi:hypothetical protein